MDVLHPLKVLGPLLVQDLDEEVLVVDVEMIVSKCPNYGVEGKQVNFFEVMTKV